MVRKFEKQDFRSWNKIVVSTKKRFAPQLRASMVLSLAGSTDGGLLLWRVFEPALNAKRMGHCNEACASVMSGAG
jgi:hypothetical protein